MSPLNWFLQKERGGRQGGCGFQSATPTHLWKVGLTQLNLSTPFLKPEAELSLHLSEDKGEKKRINK